MACGKQNFISENNTTLRQSDKGPIWKLCDRCRVRNSKHISRCCARHNIKAAIRHAKNATLVHLDIKNGQDITVTEKEKLPKPPYVYIDLIRLDCRGILKEMLCEGSELVYDVVTRPQEMYIFKENDNWWWMKDTNEEKYLYITRKFYDCWKDALLFASQNLHLFNFENHTNSSRLSDPSKLTFSRKLSLCVPLVMPSRYKSSAISRF